MRFVSCDRHEKRPVSFATIGRRDQAVGIKLKSCGLGRGNHGARTTLLEEDELLGEHLVECGIYLSQTTHILLSAPPALPGICLI